MKKYSIDDYLNRRAKDDTSPTLKHVRHEPLFGKRSLGTLGRVGDVLENFYGKSKTYQSVDLTQSTFQADKFHEQGSKLGQLLFANTLNPKAIKAYQLASKFSEKDHLSALSEQVYDQIAKVAEIWAVKSLAKDTRFGELSTLSQAQKYAFATDIANYNRTLVSLSGATGFLGLKGVVLDTAWLLLISLKSIYQFSLIYNKPLTDKDGIRLAYGILSQCDLDKLQEKQILMTALAVGDTLLKNAHNTSLTDELKKLANKYQSHYGDKLDGLGDFVDLDKAWRYFDGKWFGRVLPLVSAGVAVHYNNTLLEEVLGVAWATFADEAALIENKA